MKTIEEILAEIDKMVEDAKYWEGHCAHTKHWALASKYVDEQERLEKFKEWIKDEPNAE